MDSVRRGRRIIMLVVVLCVALLGTAVWTDVQARTRARSETADLAVTNTNLSSLQHDVVSSSKANAETMTKRDVLETEITSTLSQLGSVNSSLSKANANASLQGANIATLQTCLGGVQNALAQIKQKNNNQAAQDITAVSGPCTQLAGGSSSGLVYPFDFPDPDIIVAGNTYYAYATNSVDGNIQIITSTNLTDWRAVGNALPSLPAWASPNFTWAPSVAFIGGQYQLYYTVDVAPGGPECISVATSSVPEGPFVDQSTGPLECQKGLDGSIDPSAFIDTNGAAYLMWKSNGASKLWSEQLAPSGTAFATGTTPAALLTADRPWEGGVVEAPDMVWAGGRYFLFSSGNDWNTATYAVGVAICSGPLGPCVDASPNPILSSTTNIAGPGGETVFVDASGQFHIGFHAWVPGSVGFPNSRDLYLRLLDLSGPVPAVGGSG